jgi:hypothetical protein
MKEMEKQDEYLEKKKKEGGKWEKKVVVLGSILEANILDIKYVRYRHCILYAGTSNGDEEKKGNWLSLF